MQSDRDRWETRYADSRRAPQPPSLLIQHWADKLSGRILDLAAGSGRNTLWLARRGLHVDAVDIALAALQHIEAQARQDSLPVECVQADLTSFPLPTAAYDGVINVRYLQRSLFVPIQRCLRPGGIVLFETFLIDQRALGHPKNPEFLLAYGELRDAFADFDILFYSEGRVDTEGDAAFLARLVARRPPL